MKTQAFSLPNKLQLNIRDSARAVFCLRIVQIAAWVLFVAAALTLLLDFETFAAKSALDVLVAFALLVGIVVVSCIKLGPLRGARRTAGQYLSLQIDDDSWLLHNETQIVTVELSGQLFMSHWLILLPLREVNCGRHQLLWLWADRVDPDDFRRLWVRLQQRRY